MAIIEIPIHKAHIDKYASHGHVSIPAAPAGFNPAGQTYRLPLELFGDVRSPVEVYLARLGDEGPRVVLIGNKERGSVQIPQRSVARDSWRDLRHAGPIDAIDVSVSRGQGSDPSVLYQARIEAIAQEGLDFGVEDFESAAHLDIVNLQPEH